MTHFGFGTLALLAPLVVAFLEILRLKKQFPPPQNTLLVRWRHFRRMVRRAL